LSFVAACSNAAHWFHRLKDLGFIGFVIKPDKLYPAFDINETSETHERSSGGSSKQMKKLPIDLVLLKQDRVGGVENAAVMDVHPAGGRGDKAAVNQRKDKLGVALRAIFYCSVHVIAFHERTSELPLRAYSGTKQPQNIRRHARFNRLRRRFATNFMYKVSEFA
jgi:hypothetical protein